MSGQDRSLLSTVASVAISSEIIASTLLHFDAPVYLQDGLVLDFQSMPPRTSCIHDSRSKVLYSNFSPWGSTTDTFI